MGRQGGATIKDIAEAAGVSVSTASIALTGRGPVSEKTRARVLEAAEALNYRPNAMARGLVTRRSRTIGLVLPDITDPYFHEVAKGVERVMAEAEYTVILADTDRNPNKERRSVEALLSYRVDGMVVAGSDERSAPLYRSLGAEGVTVVGVGRRDDAFPSVDVDNAHAAALATNHLIETGRRRIALIAGPADTASAAERRSGFHAALEAAGLPFFPRWEVRSDFTPEGGRRAVHQLFAGAAADELPDAVFAANDQMAIGAIKGLRELGLRVPEDVAIAGIGDIPTAVYVHPSLTTVSLPLERMGEEAARILLRLIDGERDVEVCRLETALVVRESTGRRREGEG